MEAVVCKKPCWDSKTCTQYILNQIVYNPDSINPDLKKFFIPATILADGTIMPVEIKEKPLAPAELNKIVEDPMLTQGETKPKAVLKKKEENGEKE